MAIQTDKMIELYEMLPEKEQALAFELVKRLVLAWDPDFTKLTEKERQAYDAAKNDEYVNAEDIDWDNLQA